MSNILKNGTVLPFGLLSGGSTSSRDAFKKTYQNSSLRVGIVTQSYSVNDPNNITQIFPEYDVMTFEQNEDKGSTTITYKNCIASSSFGSIADFFEVNIRKMKHKKTKGATPSASGQNGSIVLLLCLNGLSDKGIIVGCLTHPDRKTTLKNTEPHLEGEYNGIHIVINSDGSASLVFKGATNNDGHLIDPTQGKTTVKIEKDGSFQVDHATVIFRLDKSGVVSIDAQGDVKVTTQQNAVVTANADATVTCTGTALVEGSTVKLGVGAADAVIKGDAFAKIYNNHSHLGNLGAPTSPPDQMMDPSLSKKVKTE